MINLVLRVICGYLLISQKNSGQMGDERMI